MLLLVFPSCMREDLSDCPVPIAERVSYRLAFSYLPLSIEDGEGFDPSELETLTIYVFNDKGAYVTSVTDYSPQLTAENYGIDFSLLPGAYDFYAWGNVRDHYRFDSDVSGDLNTKYSDVTLFFEGIENDTVSVEPHPLFFSSLCEREIIPYNIVPASAGTVVQTDTLHIIKNTYNLCFEVEGLNGDANSYRVVLTDDNGSYGFDNSFASSADLHYTSLFDVEDDIYYARLTCLRLERDRSPHFKLYDEVSGSMLYENNLIDLILKAETDERKIDFSRMYDFVIRLAFEIDPETGSMKLTIHVNNWEVEEKEIEIDLGLPGGPFVL